MLLTLLYPLSSWSWVAGFGSEPLVTEADLKKQVIYLAGYGIGGNRVAKTIHDDIYAKALYLKAQDSQVLLISLDAVGFSQQLAQSVLERLAFSLKLPVESILLSATHTHSSIDLQGIWGSITEAQSEQIINQIERAASRAVRQAQSAKIHLALSDQGVGYNRRFKTSHTIPQILSLNIVSATDTPIATLFSFGSHPVVLDKDNLAITSDWVHFAREVVERRLATNAMFVNSVQGDVVPSLDGKPSDTRTFEMARRYGERVGESVVKSLLKTTTELTTELRHCTQQFELEADNLALVGLLKIVNNGTVLWPTTFSPRFKTRVSVLKLGELVIVTAPGEPLTLWGEKIMARVAKPNAIFSLTHDTLGYLIPDELKKTPDYEERYQLSAAISTETITRIEQLLKQCRITTEE